MYHQLTKFCLKLNLTFPKGQYNSIRKSFFSVLFLRENYFFLEQGEYLNFSISSIKKFGKFNLNSISLFEFPYFA